MGKMKLLMLGAGLISIANFATASSEEGIVPEEVVEEELPPPPFYRYSGDEIDWVDFPRYCRRKGRGDYYCKECDITHASGYKCPIDLFCDPSKDPNELANPLFFLTAELAHFAGRAESILPLARENKSSDIVIETELPEEKRKAFYKRLANGSYFFPESGPTYSKDIEARAIVYLGKRFQECLSKQVDFACSELPRLWHIVKCSMEEEEELIAAIRVLEKAHSCIYEYRNRKPKGLSCENTEFMEKLFDLGELLESMSLIALYDKTAKAKILETIYDQLIKAYELQDQRQ